MVIGNAPRAGIDVEAVVELAVLREAAEFGVGVAAAQVQLRPPARLLYSSTCTL